MFSVLFYGFLLYQMVCRFGVPGEGWGSPKDDTLNLELAIWVPGIKLVKCPSIQGFATSLLGTQLPATLAVDFTKHIWLLGLLWAVMPYCVWPFKKKKKAKSLVEAVWSQAYDKNTSMKVVRDRTNAGKCEDGRVERAFWSFMKLCAHPGSGACCPLHRPPPPHPGPFHLPCALMSVSIVRAHRAH